jgi:hypothetical protein
MMPAAKQYHEKESSLAEAKATPSVTGTKDRYDCHARNVFVAITDKKAVKIGSDAFTIWVKDTVPAPRAITPVICDIAV